MEVNQSILGSIPHTLGFIINDICRNGYLLAYEGGLNDLKGLVDPESVAYEDFELLETLNDPVINILLDSCEKIMKAVNYFYLINGLDEFEVMLNEEYCDAASENFYLYNLEDEPVNYKRIKDNLQAFYFSVTQLIYFATWQIRFNEIHLPDEVYDQFIDDFVTFYQQKVESEDKNITLLYGLIYDLNQDMLKIDELPAES